MLAAITEKIRILGNGTDPSGLGSGSIILLCSKLAGISSILMLMLLVPVRLVNVVL